jgi:hypothetical protein
VLPELFDARLSKALSEKEFNLLKAKAEHSYNLIQQEAPAAVLSDLAELIQVVRKIESILLDDSAKKADTGWAQGSMSTLF